MALHFQGVEYLKKSGNTPIFDAYVDQCNNINTSCWTSGLHSIFDLLGLSYLRLNFDTSTKYYLLLKRTIRDQFIQEWNTSIKNTIKLYYY